MRQSFLNKFFLLLVIFFPLCSIAQTETKITINEKDFNKVGSYWVDKDFVQIDLLEIEVDSPAYDSFIKEYPEIEKYTTLGNIKINWLGKNIVITTTNFNYSFTSNVKTENGQTMYSWLIIGILLVLLAAVAIIVIRSQWHILRKK